LSYPNFNIEKKIGGTVIGIDEVGRGPLAGPVVSCACIFFDYSIEQYQLSLFDDSKKLTRKKRCEAFHKVYQLKNDNKLQFALGFADVVEIDKFNILEAAKISMKRAVQKLHYEKANLIIDGKIDLKLSQHKSNGIIKGDQKSYSIATASIIAKIHRDRYMRHLSSQHPSYDWDKNAGYGTKKHIEQIHKNGITDHHRKSFEPIKSLIHT
jgi:ribonuclease HII